MGAGAALITAQDISLNVSISSTKFVNHQNVKSYIPFGFSEGAGLLIHVDSNDWSNVNAIGQIDIVVDNVEFINNVAKAKTGALSMIVSRFFKKILILILIFLIFD